MGFPEAYILAAWSRTFEHITPEQEYYIGRAVGANVLATYKLQTNTPAMVAYINRICNTLVINTRRPEIFNGYHANILDSDEINAFATPGGHIFITRGLINCATSEDTLAAVIAHEIAHIQLEHGLKAIKSGRTAEAFSATLSYAVDVKAGDSRFPEMVKNFAGGVDEIVSTMMTKGYSRTHELEAETEALNLLALAGYDPSSLLDMLKVLEKEQSGHSGGFNSTHPSPSQRIDNVQKSVGKYSVEDTRSYRVPRYNASK
jgi:predicted Zn-dependent protease